MNAQTARPAGNISWPVALRFATTRRTLTRTILAAFLVGTTLICVNQLGAILAGSWTWLLAIRVCLSYAVPWLNATFGVAFAVRQRPSAKAD